MLDVIITNSLYCAFFSSNMSTSYLKASKTGKFCSPKFMTRSKKASETMHKRWEKFRKSDNISHINHDHQYENNESQSDISQEGIDVYEEVIDSNLPKGVVPIDKHRFVVELGHIIIQLKSGCIQCNLPLNICNSQGVLPRGLGGWIYNMCDNPAYMKMNKISLEKQHRKTIPEQNNPFNVLPHGSAIFDVNTKAASGMIHAGIGQSHLNNLLSTLNIPQISHTSLKDREEEIGAVIETFANNSVDAALMQEQELAAKEMHIEDRVPGIEISSDAAWQKRGSQCSYNSLSGIASAIGKRTKKIVHYNS